MCEELLNSLCTHYS